jgi:hypothetical protein
MTDPSRQTNPASPWVDLARNQPGQAGRERAAELYSEWRRATWWRRRTTSRSAEHDARRRAAADVYVARQFARLGPEWKVLHAIPGCGDRDGIDHLLVGPGGVFTVNSRHQADQTVWLGGDTLMVDGERIHYVRDSRAEADCASRVLTSAVGFAVPVASLIVIVGDKRFDVSCQSQDATVRVSTPRGSVRWLRHRSVEWTDYGVGRIFEAARRATAWSHVGAAATGEPATPGPQVIVPLENVRRAAS